MARLFSRLTRRQLLLGLGLPEALAAAERGLLWHPPADWAFAAGPHQDLLQLLQAALDQGAAAQGPASLQASDWLPQPRFLSQLEPWVQALEADERLQLLWAPASDELERRLLPVDFDLRRGLDGLRLALGLRRRLPEFANLRDAADLRGLRIASLRADELELDSLAGLGLRVSVFRHDPMSPRADAHVLWELESGRLDLILAPLHGPLPAQRPGRLARGLELGLEPHLLFQLSRPLRAYTSRRRPALRRRLELGLQVLHDDGRWAALLRGIHGPVLQARGLAQRRVILLPQLGFGTTQAAADLAFWRAAAAASAGQ